MNGYIEIIPDPAKPMYGRKRIMLNNPELSRARALLQKARERGDGHAISFQNDELRVLLEVLGD
jgi:hypothetical protein